MQEAVKYALMSQTFLIAGQLQDLFLIIVVLDTLVSFVFQGYYCKWVKEIGYCILKL